MIKQVRDGTSKILMGYWGYSELKEGESIETFAMSSCTTLSAFTDLPDGKLHTIIAHFGSLKSGETLSQVERNVQAGMLKITATMDRVARGRWVGHVFTGVPKDSNDVSEARIAIIQKCFRFARRPTRHYSGVKLTRLHNGIRVSWTPPIVSSTSKRKMSL